MSGGQAMSVLEKPILRSHEVYRLVGLSRSRVERLRQEGRFPQPSHKLGDRVNGWRTQDVLDWLKTREVPAA